MGIVVKFQQSGLGIGKGNTTEEGDIETGKESVFDGAFGISIEKNETSLVGRQHIQEEISHEVIMSLEEVVCEVVPFLGRNNLHFLEALWAIYTSENHLAYANGSWHPTPTIANHCQPTPTNY